MLFKIQNSQQEMWTHAGVDFALLYLNTWYMLWTVFLQNILTQKINLHSDIATLDSLNPNLKDAVAFGRHDKHPQTFSASASWSPRGDFQAFLQ